MKRLLYLSCHRYGDRLYMESRDPCRCNALSALSIGRGRHPDSVVARMYEYESCCCKKHRQ